MENPSVLSWRFKLEREKYIDMWEVEYLNEGLDPAEAKGRAIAEAGNWSELSFAQEYANQIDAKRNPTDFKAVREHMATLGLTEDATYEEGYAKLYEVQ